MSQTIAESPNSDMKMETSETTASLESNNSTSPDAGKGAPSFSESDPDDHPLVTGRKLNQPAATKLDNRRVVNCHPLMSPKPSAAAATTSSDCPVGTVFPFTGNSPTRDPSTLSPIRMATNSINNNNNTIIYNNNTNIISNNTDNKIGTLTGSHRVTNLIKEQDLGASSDSEPDLSLYQATVGPSYQSVSLVSNSTSGAAVSKLRHKSMSFTQGESGGCMKNAAMESDHNSSVESLSIRSFDDLDGIEHRRVYMSRGSSISLGDDDLSRHHQYNDTDNGGGGESRVESWKWHQKVVLPDGKMRDIDMKVIEPFKRVLSHGGYLNEGGQNAIVIFSSCFLPDRSRADYHYVMDSLFLYVVKTLEQLVSDDYVILYLHGGSCKGNVPSFPWLKRCYQLLDRRLRKSLKNVYMVHPTFWLKSLVWMSRPFISSKFWRKLVYVKTLEELYALVPTVERQAVPEKVKSYDASYFQK